MPPPPPDFPTEPTSGSSQGLFPTKREDWTSSMGVFTDPYIGFSDITFDPKGEWTGENNYWEYSIFGTIKFHSLTPSNDLPPPPLMF